MVLLAIHRATVSRRSTGTAVVRRTDGRPRPGGRPRPAKRDACTRVLVRPVFHADLLQRRDAAGGTRLPPPPGGNARARTPARGRPGRRPQTRPTGVSAR